MQSVTTIGANTNRGWLPVTALVWLETSPSRTSHVCRAPTVTDTKELTMRRFLPPILVLVGAFLFTIGLMAWLWIGPQAKQAPIDQNSRTVSVGSGSYTDLGTQEVIESDQIQSIVSTVSDQSVYEGDAPIADDVAVYDQRSDLFDTGRPAPDDSPVDYPGFPISIGQETRVAIDRVSAEPVDCCGGDDIVGLTVKWPFDVQQESYELWDGTLGAPVTMNFMAVEDIDGLEVYRFAGEVPETDTGPATDDGEFPRVFYETTKDYWVEPMTGRIIDSENAVHQWLVGEDGAVVADAADVVLGVSDETLAGNVALGKDDVAQLGLLSTASWLGPLLGLVLAAVGVWLAMGDREDEPGL